MKPAHRPHRRPRIALVAVLAATSALAAQDGDDTPVSPYREAVGATRRTADPNRRTPRAGLARTCSIDTSTRPGRTAAGGAGVLIVTVTARPGFAIDDRELIEVGCERVQGSLRIGSFEVLRRGPADAGQPADYLVLSAPFEVLDDATAGRHPVELTLSAGVVERPGDHLIGLLQDTASATVTVGAARPSPPAPTAAVTGPTVDRAEPGSGAESGLGPVGLAPLAAVTVDLAADAGARSSTDPLTPARRSRADLLWVGLGACAVLMYVLRRIFSPRP